jgi:hypothetical protein
MTGPVPVEEVALSTDRDAILLEVASWVEEGDFLSLAGILSPRKRQREDADLRIKTSQDVRARVADMIRGRMCNKVGDPVEFLADVKAGNLAKNYTGWTLREAISLADKGLLHVRVSTQIAGPWNNTVGGNTEYSITLTDEGEKALASALEARRAETGTGSVNESAIPNGETPNTSEPQL